MNLVQFINQLKEQEQSQKYGNIQFTLKEVIDLLSNVKQLPPEPKSFIDGTAFEEIAEKLFYSLDLDDAEIRLDGSEDGYNNTYSVEATLDTLDDCNVKLLEDALRTELMHYGVGEEDEPTEAVNENKSN